MEKIPYILVIGDREEKSNTIAVRKGGKVTTIKKDVFIKQIKKEIDERL
jgi:threonyl-tRNA synthetase